MSRRSRRATAGSASRVPRKEDPKLLTGRARYVGDVTVPGMLHGAVLRSPHANARIRSIDTTRARALPGVVAVLTGAEAPSYRADDGVLRRARPPARDRRRARALPRRGRRRRRGHDRYIAEDACALIDVDYEVLPAIVDPVAAMDARRRRCVHDTLDSNVVFHRSHRLRRRRRRLRARRPRDPPHARAGTAWAPSRWRRRARVASWDPFASR